MKLFIFFLLLTFYNIQSNAQESFSSGIVPQQSATVLTQSALNEEQVAFTPKYVSSHDSIYLNIVKRIYPAGRGILRTFNNVTPEIRGQFRILLSTKGFTLQTIVTHPRITATKNQKLQHALQSRVQDVAGKTLLNSINIEGFVNAKDADWDHNRALNIKQLTANKSSL